MKSDKNVKNKISFKSTLSKSNLKPLKPERINIQTIIKPKNKIYLLNKPKKIKKYFEPNEFNIKNKSTDSSYNSNKSIISSKNKKKYISDSLNSSFKSTYTTKKRKFKRNKRLKGINNHLRNERNTSNSLESNNLYMNTSNKKLNNYLHYSTSFSISNKSKNKYSNYSSSSSSKSNSEYSDSSETSHNSIQEYKKYIYYSKMIADENELDNMTRKEVGIITSDEEDNNITGEENIDKYCNNSLMNNMLQENYSEEIEHILIDIYNKNISIINSQNLGSPVSKKLFESSSIDKKKMKKIFKKQYDEKNLLVLKILSDKIKCLIEKCKEKIYEMDDINKLYEQFAKDNNNHKFCKSIGSSGLTTNSNSSSFYGSGSDEDNIYMKNNLLLNNIQDESFCKEISHDLLTQLINIKNTLKVSSKEIESIFKYAFNALKTNDGKKAKINIELVQLEQFNKVILNDNLISTLLIQIKYIFSKYKEDYFVQIIEQLQQECLMHKNSMTKFDNLLCQNLGIINDENEKNNVNDNKNESDKNNENDNENENENLLNQKIIDNNKIAYEFNDNKKIKNNLLNIVNSCSNEEENGNDENNNINESIDVNDDIHNENINDNNNENVKESITNNNENINENMNISNNESNNDNKNENNNVNIDFNNIDDLVKFINESDDKNSNKRTKKKNKKKKKKKTEEKNNNLDGVININSSPINEYINNELEDDDIIIKNFKEDIIKNTVYNYNITKIKPKLPINYSFDIFSN